MLKTLEIQSKNWGYETVSKTQSTCPTWRLLGASCESQSRSCPSPSVGFELRIFQVCVLPVIPLCQPAHMKNNKKKQYIKNRNLIVVYSARTY